MKKYKTYLSIDLDFWNRNRNYTHLRKFLLKVMEVIPIKEIRVVDSHETLLEHVNKSGCDSLINVDYHADIYDRFNPKAKNYRNSFNCGTWVNFVNFRSRGNYTWILPYPIENAPENGYCHDIDYGLNPFKKPDIAGWKKTYEKYELKPEKVINWSEIKAAGICYSYDWLTGRYCDTIVGVAKEVIGFKPKRNVFAKLH